MAERLCRQVAQFLAEPDAGADDRTATGFARARLALSLAEGLDGAVAGPRDGASAVDDLGQLAAFLDQGLPQSEWNAMVDALADDATRRAEASSAAAFLDDIDGACPPLPAGLEMRAGEAFGQEASAAHGQAVGQARWPALWPPLRALRPSLVAIALVAVATPLVVLPLIWHAPDASLGTDSGPVGRGLSPPGTGRARPADRPIAAPAATPSSCEPAANPAQGDQPAGDRQKAETESAGGRTPEQRAAAPSPDLSVEAPCRSELSGEGDRALTRPPAAGRN
jgi:hypothetical protein